MFKKVMSGYVTWLQNNHQVEDSSLKITVTLYSKDTNCSWYTAHLISDNQVVFLYSKLKICDIPVGILYVCQEYDINLEHIRPLFKVADISTVWHLALLGCLSFIDCRIAETSFSKPMSSSLNIKGKLLLVYHHCQWTQCNLTATLLAIYLTVTTLSVSASP
jgi:hypothetical protein